MATDRSVTGTVDDHIIAAMRLILAASALLVVVIDPLEPGRLATIAYATLGLYTAYSATLYIRALRNDHRAQPIYSWAHWGDVGWYVVLIALSGGANSIFFLFFFAILMASFRWGFAEGLRVTLVSAVLFTIVGYVAAGDGPEFELSRFLLRPIYLLVLGYMIAYWGGFEITLKRRLALLKEITTLSNPRFGVDRTTGIVMERLRTFFDADICLSLTIDPGTGDYRLRRAVSGSPEAAARVTLIPAELAQRLLAPPAEAVIVYRGAPAVRLRSKAGYHGYDIGTGARVAGPLGASEELAITLDAGSFVSIPLYYNHNPFGRLYLTASRPRAFDDSDADFLLQVSEHVTPILDNIRLVDRLASDAAEEERRRIARDIHDSVIQPYIGLQIGLAAIRQKLANGGDVAADVERLSRLTAEGIGDLRSYVHGLRAGAGREDGLPAAVRRYAEKFAAVTGIDVHVAASGDIQINDRLAAELFQMVAEGLSNVRRHTQARQVTIDLGRRADRVILRIANEGAAEPEPTPFNPRSIAERAMALGGQARVERHEGDGTAVVVDIPL